MKKILMVLALLGAFGVAGPVLAQDKPADTSATPAAAPAAAPAATPEPAAAAAPAAAAPAAQPHPRRRPPRPTAPTLVTADKINSGDTAWMLTSTALVLMMTIPGLALFYGGMVRKKNVLATLMQSFAITCLVTVLWVVVGYSVAFTPGGPIIGGFDRFFLEGMLYQNEAGKLTVSATSGSTIPESVYMMFQMTFAIITPALICGAFADRMKFSAMLWFMGLWSVLIYSPIAHMMWEPCGLLGGQGRARLRRRHGRAHQRRHRGPGLRAGPGQAGRLRQGSDAAAQPDADPDRCIAAVGGLVRVQRRFGGRLQRPCRHGDVRDPVRHRRGCARVDVHRVDGQGQALGPGHRVGCGRRAGRDHAGVGLRRSVRSAGHRHRGGRRSASSLRRRSRAGSATTIRWTRSACTASAASSARSLPACSTSREISGVDGSVMIQLGAVLTTLVVSGVGSYILLKIIDVTIGLRVTEEAGTRRSRPEPPRRAGRMT